MLVGETKIERGPSGLGSTESAGLKYLKIAIMDAASWYVAIEEFKH